jgi:choline kinase
MPLIEHAVIAAAGLGARLGRGHPKCLLKIHGKTLLERQLALLEEVPDVRVVVGFEEQQVVAAALKIRPDIIFVRNAAYRSTTTLHSYALGAAGLTSSCLFMDADILFEPNSFREFLTACDWLQHLIAITKAKTQDAVYTRVDNGQVVEFMRDDVQEFEWANLCMLPPAYCETGDGAVFERFKTDLPLPCKEVESFEVDTPSDLNFALENARFI